MCWLHLPPAAGPGYRGKGWCPAGPRVQVRCPAAHAARRTPQVCCSPTSSSGAADEQMAVWWEGCVARQWRRTTRTKREGSLADQDATRTLPPPPPPRLGGAQPAAAWPRSHPAFCSFRPHPGKVRKVLRCEQHHRERQVQRYALCIAAAAAHCCCALLLRTAHWPLLHTDVR